MSTYGHIILFVVPFFLGLIVLEKWIGYMRSNDTVRSVDLISSLSSGLSNIIKDVLGLSITILGYSWFVDRVAIFEIQATWLVYVLAFIAVDFAYYWSHYTMHMVNIFWNSHVIHHSSEEYNLGCALRQKISSFVNIFSFLLLPAALLGLPTEVVAVVVPIHLFSQFWYHTRQIDQLGLLEHLIVTPSHHRVHHAINPEYMNKNMSAIFIIWDKLFGTFQKEIPHIPPVYGTTRPARTWNPFKINFQHLFLLISDAYRTQSWKDKFLIWFKPTGYRPNDVRLKYPIDKIKDIYTYEKYDTANSLLSKWWAWIQLFVIFFFAIYLFSQFSNIYNLHISAVFIYGFFLFLSIYSLTDALDKNRYFFVFDFLRIVLGIFLIQAYGGGWFGASKFFSGIPLILTSYFVLSFVLHFLITQRDINRFPVTISLIK